MKEVQGLTTKDAEVRFKRDGPNKLPEKPPVSDALILLRQIKSPLIYILIAAAGVSFFLHDIPDAVIIFASVVINTVLGFYQERKAERGLAALKNMLSPQARALRDGKRVSVDAEQIVIGDVVIVTAGDRVPADGYLVEASHLGINEAVLTGESYPVEKEKIGVKPDRQEIPKVNRLFMGTTVVSGVGVFVVTKTGTQTEIGKIAQSLSQTKEEETPLQKRFGQLAQKLTYVIVISSVFLFVVGVLRQESLLEVFTTSVAIAVAAIPEGLAISLTAILALGMQRILKRKALVRKLVVAETLGTVTVIATDKTGTLTEGKLAVVKTLFTDKQLVLKAAAYANQLLDPLEIALWEWLTAQDKFDPEALLAREKRRQLLPFDPQKRYAAARYDHGVYFLGAPETLLQTSNLPLSEKAYYARQIEELARSGLRLLAVGMKKIESTPPDSSIHSPHGVVFLGLFGFADPVRKGVREALEVCRDAGIKVKVVTGDYRWTAESVMRAVSIKITKPEKEILEGEELDKLDPLALARRVEDVILFARVSPQQKLAIVEALKQKGEVVALLGDGVNDAPAIKRADIGIVVGDASDVARETADMVLLDSNFATIVAAVEEGRGIFANIQKVLMYLLSDTFAEMSLIYFGLLLGTPLPLTAAQILWINLVTDTFPTLALTMEPKQRELLKRKPIPSDLPILNRRVILTTLTISLISGLVVFFFFYRILVLTMDLTSARLIAFNAFGLKSLLYVFSLKNREQALNKIKIFDNLWLIGAVLVSLSLQFIGVYTGLFQKLLQTRPMTGNEWALSLVIAFIILMGVELVKLIPGFKQTRHESAY